MAKTLRRHVPVHPADQEAVEHLRTENSPQATALAVLTGITIGPDSSEAAALHAMMVAGRELMEQKALEDSYRREAEYARNHPDVLAWRRAMPYLRTAPTSTQDTTDA